MDRRWPHVIFLNVRTTVDEAHILFRDKYVYFNFKKELPKTNPEPHSLRNSEAGVTLAFTLETKTCASLWGGSRPDWYLMLFRPSR